MKILLVFLWWLISELIVWGAWWALMNKIYFERIEQVADKLDFNDRLTAYPKTQNRWIEWIRFIIWPYGIIQRTVMLHKMAKEVLEN